MPAAEVGSGRPVVLARDGRIGGRGRALELSPVVSALGHGKYSDVLGGHRPDAACQGGGTPGTEGPPCDLTLPLGHVATLGRITRLGHGPNVPALRATVVLHVSKLVNRIQRARRR